MSTREELAEALFSYCIKKSFNQHDEQMFADILEVLRSVAATPQSAPAATTGDTPPGSCPPASVAMGHSAGADTAATAGTADIDGMAKTIWLAEFGRAFSRTPSDPWENQAEPIKEGHRNTARKLVEAGYGPEPAATPARPTDAELLGVLNAARIALKSRDQSSFEMKVLEGLKAAIAMLEGTQPDSRPEPAAAPTRDVTEAMALAGARSIGNTIHTDNHGVRARECWRAMWDARDGIVEPIPQGTLVSRPEPAATPMPEAYRETVRNVAAVREKRLAELREALEFIARVEEPFLETTAYLMWHKARDTLGISPHSRPMHSPGEK